MNWKLCTVARESRKTAQAGRRKEFKWEIPNYGSRQKIRKNRH